MAFLNSGESKIQVEFVSYGGCTFDSETGSVGVWKGLGNLGSVSRTRQHSFWDDQGRLTAWKL
jgi:hypothetical protein